MLWRILFLRYFVEALERSSLQANLKSFAKDSISDLVKGNNGLTILSFTEGIPNKPSIPVPLVKLIINVSKLSSR